jgi:uncharacterized protein
MNRRKFINKTTKQFALFNLLGFTAADAMGNEIKDNISKDIKNISGGPIYRTLGKTGIKVPIVSMGVMNALVPNIISAAYDKGIRLFDTAWFYQRGRSEMNVGDVIEALGARDKVTISTKIFLKETNRDLFQPEIKKLFLDRFAESLQRLKMSYVDILFNHVVSNEKEINNPYVIEALNELKAQKKIRFTGVSLHGDDTAMIDNVVKVGYYDVVLVMFNVARANDADLLKSLENAAKEGVGIIAMKTQCGSGGMQWWRRPDAPQNEKPYNLNQTALLKWVLKHEFITTAIPGFTSFDQIEDDFSVAYNLEMSHEESRFLEENSIKLTQSFCTLCGKCIGTCRKNVNVPDLMRTWMYAYQYGNIDQAVSTARSFAYRDGLNPCSSCDQCSAICHRGIPVNSRIDDLKRLNFEYA